MKTPRPALVLGLSLIALASFERRCGAAGTTVFTNGPGGYEITLPSDWRQVPDEVLHQKFQKLSSEARVYERLNYKYGYQRGYAGRWFTYPYMLVQANEDGPANEKSFAREVLNGNSLESGMQRAADQSKGLFKDPRLTTPTYDFQRHLLRFGANTRLADGTGITVVSGTFLTSRGTLAFHFYAREEDFDGFKEAFDSAIDSVRLSSELAYKPPPSPFAKLYRTLIFAVIGACAGVIVAIVRRRSARTPPPLPPSHTA